MQITFPLELITMAEKTKLITCRLSEDEFSTFLEHAHDLELSKSDYLRFLIRIPVTADGLSVEGGCISLDMDSVANIYSELVRWGRHYNQAVKALNTIARQMTRGRIDENTIAELLERANKNLAETDKGRKEILDQMYRIETLTLVGE